MNDDLKCDECRGTGRTEVGFGLCHVCGGSGYEPEHDDDEPETAPDPLAGLTLEETLIASMAVVLHRQLKGKVA